MPPTPSLILFAGGGTGGHLVPGLAVAAECRARWPQGTIVCVGSERELETRLVRRAGFEHVALPAEPAAVLRRRPLRFLLRSWDALRRARRLIAERRPDLVVGLGGFASVPVLLAARMARVPIVLLEQNRIPGRANRLAARWADAVCATYPDEPGCWPRRTRIVLTGNPVRAEIAALADRPSTPCASTRPSDPASSHDPPLLLVLGGSQGSQAVNGAVLHAARILRSELAAWRIVHQTGTEQESLVREEYAALGLRATVAAFFDDLSPHYAAAELIVARAGATTLAEVACAGCPALLIPYPQAADDHQRRNAEFFAAVGASETVAQGPTDEETGTRLADTLRSWTNDAGRRTRARDACRGLARPDAAGRVADVLCDVLAERIAGRFVGGDRMR